MRSNVWRSSLRQLPQRKPDEQLLQRISTISRSPSNLTNGPSRRVIVPGRDSQQTRWNSTAPAESPPPKPNAVTDKQERQQGRQSVRRKEITNGIPPAPPLPEWFLQYNVRIQEGDRGQGEQRKDKARALCLLDPYNDSELLTIPYVEPVAARERLQQLKDSRLPEAFFDSSGAAKHDGTLIAEQRERYIARVEERLEKDEARQAEEKKETDSDVKDGEEKLTLPQLHVPLDEASWARLQGQLLLYASFQTMARPGRKLSPNDFVIYSPDPTMHDELDRFVEDTAELAQADIIRIDASDIAELAGDYVNPTDSGPGSISGLAFDTYEGGRARTSMDSAPPQQSPEQVDPRDVSDQSREDLEPMVFNMDGLRSGNQDILKAARKKLEQLLGGQVVGMSVGMPMQNMLQSQTSSRSEPKHSDVDDMPELDRWQRLKLKTFFDQLLDAPSLRKKADLDNVPYSFIRQKFADIRSEFKNPDIRREVHDASDERREHLAQRYGRTKLINNSLRLQLAHHIHSTFGDDKPATAVVQKLNAEPPTVAKESAGTILHIRDISLIYDSPHGEDIVKLLKHAVQNRQKNGERIMIVGTDTEYHADVSTPLSLREEEDLEKEEGFLRITYNPSPISTVKNPSLSPIYPVEPGSRRLLELNLRHVQDTIARLGIPCSPRLFSEMTRSFLYAPRTQKLGDVALSPGQIQKIVLAAEGFRSLYTTSPELEMTHLAIAVSILDVLEQNNVINVTIQQRGTNTQSPQSGQSAPNVNADGSQRKSTPNNTKRTNLEELRKFASKHEQRLFPGIVDPANIKTTYNDVHVAPETIDALKTVTTLALLRPEAFSYGVLAKDRLTGLLLYGPPGTGKTLLAKAVAKDAQATVLEVSGAQVYEKYVGEGEKMVRAVFSLAKRLSPCVVFIDEADALFGSRGQSGNRTTHREIINQFLREWDGMDDHNVFLMVASNRPFEIDDAVLRRLPRRILVDLPTKQDRESILKIHLNGEILAEDVEVSKLAEQTPFYSGSDLKNVAVAAALAAVKEENELLAKNKEDKEFTLPERRTLTKGHFEKAIQEISASISEDMRSLNAIKKFDEQYGDRKGRKKKEGYGFAGLMPEEDEAAARVRGGVGPKP
ncbi:hypothetical protein CAC42_4792 [Sphaceloma murrayae]|uniref:AAA+ ATPase domain-containing protein n=1 Tax=Sphaceloma murrayae TaxID=2082308 RepID=A0A2K1QNY6_9PEZI|nr:hypothetical protein CAC42_4792 [Sphaceloma murrayae]